MVKSLDFFSFIILKILFKSSFPPQAYKAFLLLFSVLIVFTPELAARPLGLRVSHHQAAWHHEPFL